MLLDTNVLVSRFDPRDSNNEHTTVFLDTIEYQLLVASVVVVEAWGMLVSRKVSGGGRALLTWLNTPGRAMILPRHDEPLQSVGQLVNESSRLDCVDAMLAELADDITRQCSLIPALRIATYDVVDYFTIKSIRKDLRLTVYDVGNLEDESDSSE